MVAVWKSLLHDADLTDESAIGAANVSNDEAAVGPRDRRMIPGRAFVSQDHVVIVGTSNTGDTIRSQDNSIARLIHQRSSCSRESAPRTYRSLRSLRNPLRATCRRPQPRMKSQTVESKLTDGSAQTETLAVSRPHA
jgi:hypothetical protein